MGFFSVIKKIFGGQSGETEQPKPVQAENTESEQEQGRQLEQAQGESGEEEQPRQQPEEESGQPEAGPESGAGSDLVPEPEAKSAGGEGQEAFAEPALEKSDAEPAQEMAGKELAPTEETEKAPDAGEKLSPEPPTETAAAEPLQPGPGTEPEAEAEQEQELRPDVVAGSQPGFASKDDAEPQLPEEPEAELGTQAETMEPAQAEIVAEAEPEAAPEPEAEPEPGPEADAGPEAKPEAGSASQLSETDHAIILSLRQAEPRLSAWLGIVLEGVEEKGDLLWQRVRLLLSALEAPANEADEFVNGFADWLERMEYRYLEEFRSELQYRLALALDLEDEEDERNRLLVKISAGLAKTREHLARGLDSLFAGHGKLDDAFWEELEEVFIMADLGVEPSLELVARLKERARKDGVSEPAMIRDLLQEELEEIFRIPPHIVAVNPPEVVLMIGVNGAGKTTTIAKLAHRARMQGKKVMIAAADTFRAAAIEQLEVWAGRVGALFHAGKAGSDPAAVAFQAMDKALEQGVDLLLVDTAGRLQTKINLMEELGKIRMVLGKKHQGAPHRSILVLDATTGQNALSQTKLFRDAAGIDELILTKMDGTAKGGVAIAIAMQYHLPISYIGLGEKLEDLRPFNGQDYARAILGSLGNSGQAASGKASR